MYFVSHYEGIAPTDQRQRTAIFHDPDLALNVCNQVQSL